jgi:hypothetical protein
MTLNICYITARENSRFEWFADSLIKQCNGNFDNIKVIVISRHLWYNQKPEYFSEHLKPFSNTVIIPPKPSVWAGLNRLTDQDWFSAANSRNSGLCHCEDGFCAYADDLAVLLPDWLDRVKAAMDGGYIACGKYQKVKDLVVENGEVKSFTDYPQGHDSRAQFAKSPLQPCADGGWMFGCSVAMPVEALLTIGGWTEFVDGMGSEDSLTGLTLQNAGFKMFYDQKMLTYESEELHHVEPALGRTDKGVSPDDKSHRALNIVLSGQKFFDNYYKGGMRALREKVLKDEPFPIVQIPEADWYDGEKISEMSPIPKPK